MRCAGRRLQLPRQRVGPAPGRRSPARRLAFNPPRSWSCGCLYAYLVCFRANHNSKIASHRSYVSYDRYLRTGPYNFGFAAKPNWAEHFP
jgi:hypothetical protein